MGRVYIGGYNKFGWVDPSTLVYTAMTDPGVERYVNAILHVTDDNIWIGFRETQNACCVAHWNGASWTVYNSGTSGYEHITSFLYISETEIYASGCLNGWIYKWNGSSWSQWQQMRSDADYIHIMPGSTASDMHMGTKPGAYNYLHWNGASKDIEELTASSEACAFIRDVGGVVHMGIYQNAKLRKRTGVATWPEQADGGYQFGASSRDCAWINPINDDLWMVVHDTSTTWKAGIWNGTTLTLYGSGAQFTTTGVNVDQLTGIFVNGLVEIWTIHRGSSYDGFSVRDPDTGDWSFTALAFAPSAIKATSPVEGPTIENHDPAPDSTGNAADTSVCFDVLDEIGDLDTSTIKVWINGTLAVFGLRAASGFSLTATATSSGPPGFTLCISPAADFEAGTQTIRATASDLEGNSVDETWTFDTIAALVTDDDATTSEESTLAYYDLKLDTAHDVIVEDYDLVLVAGVDEVAQHLLVGLRLFWGEWYLDDDAGVPYYRDVFINNPNSRVIEGLFRQHILGDDDIESITEFQMSIDRATRHLDVDFTAVSKVGEVEISAVFP